MWKKLKSFGHDTDRFDAFLEVWRKKLGVEDQNSPRQPADNTRGSAVPDVAVKQADAGDESKWDGLSEGNSTADREVSSADPLEVDGNSVATDEAGRADNHIPANESCAETIDNALTGSAGEMPMGQKKTPEYPIGEPAGLMRRIPVWRTIMHIADQVSRLESHVAEQVSRLESHIVATDTKRLEAFEALEEQRLVPFEKGLAALEQQQRRERGSAELQHQIDTWYQTLQDQHRGTDEHLASSKSIYMPYFEVRKPILKEAGPILDLGCGRGDWLKQMTGLGWSTKGVDSSQLAVEHAVAEGLDVVCEDLLDFLSCQPANSLAAVTGFQVIEHLPFATVFALVQETYRALLPGGMLLLETPNPENLQVASYSFWMDPTHRAPIPPPLLMDLSFHLGFRDGLILRSNPWPQWEGESKELAGDAPLSQKFYCPQDYALLVYKPVEAV